MELDLFTAHAADSVELKQPEGMARRSPGQISTQFFLLGSYPPVHPQGAVSACVIA
jgi:hypothetical protein